MIVTDLPLFKEGRIREEFGSDKQLVELHWALLQLAEDSKDVKVPLASLSFLKDVDIGKLDPATFTKMMQTIVMTQLRHLADPTDGSPIGVNF